MIAELTDDHFGDQTRPGDAAWYRPRWKRSRRDAVLTTPAGVFRADMDMGFQLRWLKFQFTRNVLTNTVHPSAAARAVLFFFGQVVLVAYLRQLVPVDLAILTATAMALPLPFGKTLSPSTERPPLVPSQFVERGGVLLLQ